MWAWYWQKFENNLWEWHTNDVICHYLHVFYITDWRKTVPCLNSFWVANFFFLSIIVSFVLLLEGKGIFFVSHPIPPFTYLRIWWLSAWGRCIAIILQASYPCDSDDTKWHRRLIHSIFLDGDCIPLSFTTWITTAGASGTESTVFPADRFFYTKALRLYSKMDIQVYNTRNRDVKGDDTCSLL